MAIWVLIYITSHKTAIKEGIIEQLGDYKKLMIIIIPLAEAAPGIALQIIKVLSPLVVK